MNLLQTHIKGLHNSDVKSPQQSHAYHDQQHEFSQTEHWTACSQGLERTVPDVTQNKTRWAIPSHSGG